MCAKDEARRSSYPNLEEDILTLHRRLQTNPLAVLIGDQSIVIDAQQFAVPGYGSLYDISKARFIPSVVKFMLDGTESQGAPRVLVGPLPAQGESGPGWPAHFAFVCAKDPTSSFDQAHSLDVLRFDLVLDYVRADAGEYIALCEHMGLPVLPIETDLPVRSDGPVLILNGGFDPFTPTLTSISIAEVLPNSFNVSLPFGDHVAGSTDQSAHDIMIGFSADPSQRPESACTADPGNFEWYIAPVPD